MTGDRGSHSSNGDQRLERQIGRHLPVGPTHARRQDCRSEQKDRHRRHGQCLVAITGGTRVYGGDAIRASLILTLRFPFCA